MGLNFYAYIIPTVDDTEVFESLAKSKKWNDLYSKLKVLDPIHIGKCSKGYRFIFNRNNYDHYSSTKAGITYFLRWCKIEDDYGREWSQNDFWQMVLAHSDLNIDVCAIEEDGLTWHKENSFS